MKHGFSKMDLHPITVGSLEYSKIISSLIDGLEEEIQSSGLLDHQDLMPLDYFLSSFLKSKVYTTRPQNLEELRNQIMREATLIDREMIHRVVTNFYSRIASCQEVQGVQLEYMR